MPTHRRASLVAWSQRLRAARDDPEGVLQLVREAEQGGGSDAQLLAEIYGVAAEHFPGARRAQDPQFEWLCVKCLRALCQTNPADAREFHNKLRAEGVGQLDARLYEARAAMEERLGDTAKAARLLQEGLKVRAEPAELLRRALRELWGGDGAAPAAGQLEVREPAPRPAPPVLSAPPAAAGVLRRRLVQAREELARRAEETRGRDALAVALAAWRSGLQEEQQSRREALFDSMAGQVQAARAAAAAAAWSREALVSVLRRRRAGAVLRAALAAWACASQLAVARCATAESLGRGARRRSQALLGAAVAQMLVLWQQLAAPSRPAAAPPAELPRQRPPAVLLPAAAAAAQPCVIGPPPAGSRSPQAARRFSFTVPAGVTMVDCILEDVSQQSPNHRREDSVSSRCSQQAAPLGASSRGAGGSGSLSPMRCRRAPDVQVHTHLSRRPQSVNAPARASASLSVLAAPGASRARSESPAAPSSPVRLRLRRASCQPTGLGPAAVQAGSPSPALVGGRSPLADVAGRQPSVPPLPLPTASGATAGSAASAPPPPPPTGGDAVKPGSPGAPAASGRKSALRGPARFYYDKSSYTGCARFGGPTLADGKENGPAMLRPNLNRSLGKSMIGGSAVSPVAAAPSGRRRATPLR